MLQGWVGLLLSSGASHDGQKLACPIYATEKEAYGSEFGCVWAHICVSVSVTHIHSDAIDFFGKNSDPMDTLSKILHDTIIQYDIK